MRHLKILGLAALLAVMPALAQTPAPDAAASSNRAPKLSFTEKMAKAETDLALTPAQKPLWDAYLTERKDSYAARKSQPPLDLPTWLAAQQKQYASEAQALAPLWASLTVTQRRIADADLMPHRRGKRSKETSQPEEAVPAPQ